MIVNRLTTGEATLVHTRAVAETHLALEFAPDSTKPIQVVLEVLDCRPFGPFYEISGRFRARLES